MCVIRMHKFLCVYVYFHVQYCDIDFTESTYVRISICTCVLRSLYTGNLWLDWMCLIPVYRLYLINALKLLQDVRNGIYC